MSNMIDENEHGFKTYVSTNFTEIAYEIEKNSHSGWELDKIAYPFHNFVMFEATFIRNPETIERAKDRARVILEGKELMTKERRQESMAKARAAVGKSRNKGDASDES